MPISSSIVSAGQTHPFDGLELHLDDRQQPLGNSNSVHAVRIELRAVLHLVRNAGEQPGRTGSYRRPR